MSDISVPSSGIVEDGVHKIAFRVYYEDTDAGGIVYHANYFRFAERARMEALRFVGIDHAGEVIGSDAGFVVGRAQIEWRAPLRLDDVVTVETSLQELRKVRMTMLQMLTCRGREMARIVIDIVMIGADGRATPIPESIAQRLMMHLPVRTEG